MVFSHSEGSPFLVRCCDLSEEVYLFNVYKQPLRAFVSLGRASQVAVIARSLSAAMTSVQTWALRLCISLSVQRGCVPCLHDPRGSPLSEIALSNAGSNQSLQTIS